jgi:hypothetical protein
MWMATFAMDQHNKLVKVHRIHQMVSNKIRQNKGTKPPVIQTPIKVGNQEFLNK